MDAQVVPVVYVLGVAHSGTTLTDLLLGSHSRIESLGEVHKYWRFFSPRSPREQRKRICTCGVPIMQCEYWAAVRAGIRERLGSDDIDLETTEPEAFARNNAALFQAVRQHTGKPVLCDSSKWPGRLEQLLASPAFEVHIAHLVRDCRAVALSYRRRRKSPLPAALRWQSVNLRWARGGRASRGAASYTLLRYEDLVADPEGAVTRLLRPLDLAMEPGQLRYGEHPHHNISGNDMRITPEKQSIRQDTAYLRELGPWDWWLCTGVASRALLRFGYPLRPRIEPAGV